MTLVCTVNDMDRGMPEMGSRNDDDPFALFLTDGEGVLLDESK